MFLHNILRNYIRTIYLRFYICSTSAAIVAKGAFVWLSTPAEHSVACALAWAKWVHTLTRTLTGLAIICVNSHIDIIEFFVCVRAHARAQLVYIYLPTYILTYQCIHFLNAKT